MFGNFQLGSPRISCADEPNPAPPAYCLPTPEMQDSQPLHVTSISPTITDSAKTLLAPKSCLYCRGRRYDYTAYFHNTKVFAEPPHELLTLVEESYVQKNRLQSLLINYALRDIQEDNIEQIQKELTTWEAQVHNLATAVGDTDALLHLRSWASKMMQQLWEHVSGLQKMEMPPGRSKEFVSEFRKLWEAVWVRCVLMKSTALRDEMAPN
ncbi:hypothetical protein EG329_004544 [Mollisiaceae sp. DMI_Dod_QoI]|nr:hypothetical protein EG329_004544 [Helotiales sp. DMI_Dod_QoI]